MKYIKRFNEELNSNTYWQAAKKLKDLGHVRRSSVIDNWAKKVHDSEKEIAIVNNIEKYSKNGIFDMTISKSKWNASTRSSSKSPFISGKFYICLSIETDMFEDTFSYWSSTNEGNFNLSFTMGVIPADEETKKDFDAYYFEVYTGVTWLNWLCITLSRKNDNFINPSDIEIESREDDIALFSNRREAIKFRKLIFDEISGVNNVMDIKSRLEESVANIEKENPDSELEIGKIPSKICNYLRNANVNKLFID